MVGIKGLGLGFLADVYYGISYYYTVQLYLNGLFRKL